MRIGDQGVFCGYANQLAGAPPVFERGDLVVVSAIDDEGVYRCHALGPRDAVLAFRSDMVLDEEVIPLTHASVISVVVEELR